MNTPTTIFALATPPAKSGVAVVRISGPQALAALQALTGKAVWQPNLATLATLRHPAAGHVIDRALCLYFKAPKSFTGEEVAELHCHGSRAVMRELLELLAALPGLRPAEAGEFTRRAFLNGKMDLLEAEGLADLIDAETLPQKQQALGQMEGALSERYESLRSRIVTALALLEAYIDFPEEDIPESVIASTQATLDGLKADIAQALADGGRGERLRDGVQVVILGAPNAGKSSLLNRLAGREAAIVSHRAGTTRDAIEVQLQLAGFPVILTDTAGLRDTQDSIEEEGIRRALARAGQADVKLAVFDASQPADTQTLAQIDDKTLIINNKIDLTPHSTPIAGQGVHQHFISTHTGQGVGALLCALAQRISEVFGHSEAPLITRSRHRAHLQACHAQLSALNWQAPLELSCEELRLAAREIGKITGKIAVDDVLDVIFKQFCIGK